MEEKRVAIELWKVGTDLKVIRARLGMPARTLRRLIAAIRQIPADMPCVIPERKKKTVAHNKKISPATLKKMEKLLKKTPTLSGKQLKMKIPELEGVAIRTIQRYCCKTLKLPARKMAKKPFLNERMKAQRLAFAEEYGNWTVEDWKRVVFADESHFELRSGN